MLEGVSPTFFDYGGTKTRLWVHCKVKLNINSSSQYMRLQYTMGGRGTVSVDTNGEGVGGGIPLLW